MKKIAIALIILLGLGLTAGYVFTNTELLKGTFITDGGKYGGGPSLPSGTRDYTRFTVTKTADTADGTCDTDCSLREAIDAANAASDDVLIEVPAGTYTLSIPNTSGDEDINISGDLDVGSYYNKIVIEGEGSDATIIDGGGVHMNDRVMHVKGGTNVKLENLTVQNGHTAANYGGAIYNLGELEIDGCVVTGSYGNSGGNIANIGGGTLLIQDSTVSHGDALVYGGGIVNYAGGTLVIEASVIENNYANDDGGGILNNNESTLSITDSIISNNEALDNAGGISNADEASAEIYNSTVTNNIAGVDAGGIQNGGSSTFTIEASIISNNSAGDDAGGIYNGGVDAYLHLLDSEMTGNFAANDGGGFMHTNNSSMLIEDSLIGDNEAGSDGGAALIYSDNITITSVIFSGNIAQARGGAIYNSAAEVSVGESSLYLNEAQQGGGAIYNAPGGEIALETLSITDNTSGLDGCGFGSGAIHNTDLMEIDQSLIANNSSSYSGGGIFNKSTGDLDIANTTIYGNEVTDKNSYGGGVYSYTGGTVNISACTITENTAPSGAGGIYGDATGVNIINTIVSGNTVSSLVENCNTDLASSGYNLEDRDTCGFDATGDQTNTRPIFDSAGLADNGGSTHTIALGTSLFRNSSPAINAGLCEDIDGNTITVDQRNYFRDNVCDIGAYEVQ